MPDRHGGPTLRDLALAALADSARDLRGAAADAPEVQYLGRQRERVVGGVGAWAAGVPAALERPAAEDEALLRLGEELALETVELLAVTLAAAVEDDAMAGRAVAFLQAPLGGSRPVLGLLANVLAPAAPAGASALDVLTAGPAVRSGLLQILPGNGPLPERAVAVPPHVAKALAGLDAAPMGVQIGDHEETVPLAPSTLLEAQRQAAAMELAPGRSLVVRSGSGAERRAVAAAIARELGLRPVFLGDERVEGLGPWLAMRRLLPVVTWELGPGDRRTTPAIPLYAGPLLVLAGPDGSVETPAGDTAPGWRLQVPPPEEREALWAHALSDGNAAADLARHHRHGTGRIALLSRLARHRSRLRGAENGPERADVEQASRSGEGIGLEALAVHLSFPVDDAALVAAGPLATELDRLLLRCRSRDGLVDGLGASASARYTPGVRALFTGPSGTGKTLAAGWLATRLQLPLFRVDLASVTSKYIGETEKNLAQLLARAEQSEVVLLFDEADSLFGKRTDVRDANDRFANAQTNYLLQRIEEFDGIVILTSNSRARFDSAFFRRLDTVVEFPLPGPEERRRLWASHLGDANVRRIPTSDLNRIAATADLAGGHIRNAVLLAALLARAADRDVTLADVLEGVGTEYRKLGRQLPTALRTDTPAARRDATVRETTS